MIKIVEIKGGLKEYHEQKEFTFEDKGFIIGKSRRKGFSGLHEQITTRERVNNITRAQLEEAVRSVSSSRGNGMTIYASAEGHRQFQEALQEEASRQLDALNVVLETERNPLRNTIVFGTGGEVTDSRGNIMGSNYTAGLDPIEPLIEINPTTGNTETLLSNGNSVTFSRDMTEEQIIAHFDSLN